MKEKLSVALLGLRFGGAFAEIWRDHPDVESIGLYDPDTSLVESFRLKLGNVKKVKIYSSFEEVLQDENLDAVHLVTPIPMHANQTVAVLNSGKHCACTVPMAVSLEEIRDITKAVRKSGKKYMMMETTLYTYQYMHVKKMLDSGEIGRIQFLRGSHYQDMENWPKYWDGLPPMWYGTHAIAPMVGLSGSRIASVSCLGSGTMREELQKNYGNPFPIETAHFRFENGLAGEATRSLFETAHAYIEGMYVYGSKASFEWGFDDSSNPYITHLIPQDEYRGFLTDYEQIEVPNYYDDLPKELWQYTVGDNYDATNPQESLKRGAGAGHHGSHSHLVNEFVRAIIEDRKPWIDEEMAANITAAGILAHESAMRDGERLIIPRF